MQWQELSFFFCFFFAQTFRISYFNYIFDVMYDLIGIMRNEFYFCGFYGCVNADISLSNLIQRPLGLNQFVCDSHTFRHQ